MAMSVVQAGEARVERRDGREVAVVQYLIDGGWDVRVERDLLAPTGGPTRLVVEASANGVEGELGGWDGPGLQVTQLRAVPLADARRQLEQLWIDSRARSLIDGLPTDFVGDLAFAKLAEVMVVMHEWNVPNPIGVIARHREPHTHGTWATRVKRARERGFMTTGSEPALTGKSIALLRG